MQSPVGPLVTGAGGRVAAEVVGHLARSGYRVVGTDRPGVSPHPECSEWREADVTDADEVGPAVAGAEAVIHTAAIFPGAGRSGTTLLKVNVGGTYNVLDAARRHDVRKVVLLGEAPVHLASTDGDKERAWRSSDGEDHIYDLSKRLQEEVARDFCETFGMSVVALRIGHVVDGFANRDLRGRPLEDVQYSRGGWVCCHDIARACDAAIRANLPGFTALPVVGSAAGHRRFAVGDTERVLSFQVCERFDSYT